MFYVPHKIPVMDKETIDNMAKFEKVSPKEMFTQVDGQINTPLK